MDFQEILKLASIKHFDHREEYHSKPGVTLLLQNNIDIRERTEYYNGWRRLDSITGVAILLNETDIFEIMTKNREKLNPNIDMKSIEKNTYHYAQICGRKDILKIMEKYGISYKKEKISEKRKKILLDKLDNFGLSYKHIKFFKSKGIDILKNMKFIKTTLQGGCPFSGAIIAGEIEIFKLIIKHKKHFDIHFDWQIDNFINFQLATAGKNKQILSILQKYRNKMDKQIFINKGYHLIDAERFDDLFKLTKDRINFDESYRTGGRYFQAFALNRSRKYKEATKVLKRRLEFDPNDTSAISSLILSFQNLGNWNDALIYANRNIKAHIIKKLDFFGVYICKARILYELGKYPLAIKYYRKEISNDPEGHNKKNALDWIKRCKEAMKGK